jgi:hypothetical protein
LCGTARKRKTALEEDPYTVKEATDPRNCLIIDSLCYIYLKNDVEIRGKGGENNTSNYIKYQSRN